MTRRRPLRPDLPLFGPVMGYHRWGSAEDRKKAMVKALTFTMT